MRITSGYLQGIIFTAVPLIFAAAAFYIGGPWYAVAGAVLFSLFGWDMLLRPKSLVEIHDDKVTLHIGSVFSNPPSVEINLSTIESVEIERVSWRESDYSGKVISFCLTEKPVYLRKFLNYGKWDPAIKKFQWVLPLSHGVDEAMRFLESKLSAPSIDT